MGKIYLITNTINNKVYVGQTKHSIEYRFKEHQHPSKKTTITQAIQKYGKENFTVELLEECNIHNLDERETFYIEKYNSYKEGYNNTIGGGSQYIAHTPEVKQKLSISAKGKLTGDKNPAKRPEVRKKISDAQKKRVENGEWKSPTEGGHTEEALEKLRANQPDRSGKNNSRYGVKMSEETKQKIREKQLAAQERKRKNGTNTASK
jgi:group I intron endonuclease